MKVNWYIAILGRLIAVAICFNYYSALASEEIGSSSSSAKTNVWKLSNANPLLARGKSHFGLDSRLIWNDPSVLKEHNQYSMWVSAGFSAHGAKIYRLISADGISWQISNGGKPVLEAGTKDDFDCLGVETPAVLKVKNIYHMYYSAYKRGDAECSSGSIFVTMGHATSQDGIHWNKQGELTSLTEHVGNGQGNRWGWLARGEPSAVFINNKFYLYFADVRCRRDDCSGSPAPERGISVATSLDGHYFRQLGSTPVLLQTSVYSDKDGWEGYSTPWAIVKNGKVDLFVDVAKTIDGKFYQTALAHFTSTNGQKFSLVHKDIVLTGQQSWFAGSVRAPSVLEENGILRMWFAGDNDNDGASSSSIIAGIGLAERTY